MGPGQCHRDTPTLPALEGPSLTTVVRPSSDPLVMPRLCPTTMF